MKILKEGQIPEKTIKWYKVECGNCGTSVTFNELDKDVAITRVKTLDGEDSYKFKCPLCGEQVEGLLKCVQYTYLPVDQEPNEKTQWSWPYYNFSKQTIIEPIKFPTTILGTYDCETCPVNPWKNNNGGGIKSGDTPCNWCPKMMPITLCNNK